MSLRHYTWRSMQQRPGRTILDDAEHRDRRHGCGRRWPGHRDDAKRLQADVRHGHGQGDAGNRRQGGGEPFSPRRCWKKLQGRARREDRRAAGRSAGSMTFGDGKRMRLQSAGHRSEDRPAGARLQDRRRPPHRRGLTRWSSTKGSPSTWGSGSATRSSCSAQAARVAARRSDRRPVPHRERVFAGPARHGAHSHRAPPRTTSTAGVSPKIRSTRFRSSPTASPRPIERQAWPRSCRPGCRCIARRASTQLMQETLMSSEQGLELTTIFSLLMAAFIILNTFLMNVSERRRHISIMRAIGATRTQITLGAPRRSHSAGDRRHGHRHWHRLSCWPMSARTSSPRRSMCNCRGWSK